MASRATLGLAVALVAVLTAARVAEVLTGHTPTGALTAAFSGSVAVALALLAAKHLNGTG